MPQDITDPKIIKIMSDCVKLRDELADIMLKIEQAAHDLEVKYKLADKTAALNKKQREGFLAMNDKYGWGKWMDIDAKKLTFIPESEISDKYYILNNPALREKVKVDDVETAELKGKPNVSST